MKNELTKLEAQRRQLDAKIRQLKIEETRTQVATLREKHAVQVACSLCHGTGRVSCGGADILSDPPYEEACEDCAGQGFVWRLRFPVKHPDPQFLFDCIEGNT